MSTPAEREKMLAKMTRAEKAELLRWIVRDLGDDFPGIKPCSMRNTTTSARFAGVHTGPHQQ